MSAYRTPPAYAKQLGVKAEKVIGWIRRGELRAINVSDGTRPLYRISESAIAEFEERRAAATTKTTIRRTRQETTSVRSFIR